MKRVYAYYMAFALLLSPSLPKAQDVSFYSHFIMPFTYVHNGELRGLAVDIVKELMAMVDHRVLFSMVSFKRGLVSVQEGSQSALFVAARRPEREGTVKWVGPLISSAVYFYKRVGSPVELTGMNDLKTVGIISVERGNADHTFLKSLGLKNIVQTHDHMASLKQLVAGRVDVTPMSELVMPIMAEQAGIPLDKIVRTDLKLYDSDLYIAFSLDVPDATVAKWQRALDELKSSGRYEAIVNTYIAVDATPVSSGESQ